MSECQNARQKRINLPVWQELRLLLPTKGEYEHRQAYEGFECRKIEYRSDRLKVRGYIWKPQNIEGKNLPLIIFNRGGSLELAKLTLKYGLKFGFYDFLANGFVAIGSQYRGNAESQGKEEFSGADINDAMNLIPLARSWEYIDSNNIFIMGESRGGMMTYLALKQEIEVNAAATVTGAADLSANLQTFPALRSRWGNLFLG